MSPKSSPKPSALHPQVGTLIDDGGLELVEVLGVGGYGVVYRAVDVRSPRHSYAVKCLLHHQRSYRQRIAHIREIALHQIASAHPNVVTLHRVLEEEDYTYIVMDYASDGDLFTQILHEARYQGDDYIIKQVFLQLLDAVEYCHSLGIYHRDLKPENILCFDKGMRVAVTDFGLATSDKVSEDFRTGSVYHMSPGTSAPAAFHLVELTFLPECHDEEYARRFSDPSKPTYSPMFNDIWSLAIVLLNLTTGRNPWRSASVADPTFQAFLRDPQNFLPTVLPISPEINAILVRMLALDWRQRMTIPELRMALSEVDSFYSEDVIFDGSMAKCVWEAGVQISEDSTMRESTTGEHVSQATDLKSHWSAESKPSSDIVFAKEDSEVPSDRWREREQSSANATWAHFPTMSDVASPINVAASTIASYATTSGPSSGSSYDSHDSEPHVPSLPSTPSDFSSTFERAKLRKQLLTIDTSAYARPPRYYGPGYSESDEHSIMHTALDNASSYYIASSMSHNMASPGAVIATPAIDDKEMGSPCQWDFADDEPSVHMYPSSRNSLDHHSMVCEDPMSVSPIDNDYWSSSRSQPIPIPPPRDQQCQPHHIPPFDSMTDYSSFSRPDGRDAQQARGFYANKNNKTTNIFNPVRFFPRPSSPSPPSPFSHVHERRVSDPVSPMAPFQTPSPCHAEGWCAFSPPKTKQSTIPLPTREADCRREAWLRSPRRWFSPARLFSGTGAS
ncbi:hypothetical protein EYR38_002182 [Pleurotus pulmonarius]|nr:hypothetical protein EYR38_002182 [Pleurotus pulmonarius]